MKKGLRGDETVEKYRDGNQWSQFVLHLEIDQRLRINPQESTMRKYWVCEIREICKF